VITAMDAAKLNTTMNSNFSLRCNARTSNSKPNLCLPYVPILSIDGIRSPGILVHLGTSCRGGAGLSSPKPRPSLRGAHSFHLGLWERRADWSPWRVSPNLSNKGGCSRYPARPCGRKASTDLPWLGGKSLPQDKMVGTDCPSAEPFSPLDTVPRRCHSRDRKDPLCLYCCGKTQSLRPVFKSLEIPHGPRLPLTNFSPRCRTTQDE